MDEELKTSAEKLDVSQQDVNNIKRKARIYKIIYWVFNAIIAIITFIAGFMIGSEMGSVSTGYPYAGGLLAPTVLGSKSRSRMVIFFSVLIGILIALKVKSLSAYEPEYTVSLYGVYKK